MDPPGYLLDCGKVPQSRFWQRAAA